MDIILCLIGTAWLVGFAWLWRVPRCGLDPQPAPCPRVSVIIPARNEEGNLQSLLSSLNGQDLRPAEVIVVDDHSQDRTAEVAQRGSAKVIASRPLPADWLGKPWACQQGAEQATGEVLVFLDADTWLEPGGMRRLLDTLGKAPGALSLSPFHHTHTWQEQFSAYFNLVQTAGVNAFSLWGSPSHPAGLFGPCLVIRREDYFRAGGHEAVRGQLLENYSLARPLAEQGVAVRLYGGRGAVSIRLYPGGVKELVQGWSKSITRGAGRTPASVLVAAAVWIAGQLFLVCAPALGMDPLLWLVAYALFAGQVAWQLGRIGAFKVYAAVLFPVLLVFFLVVFARAAIQARGKKSVIWKGREIRLGE